MGKQDNNNFPHDNQGGYAERGPGRGDHAGRGRGGSTESHPREAPEEREPSERSRCWTTTRMRAAALEGHCPENGGNREGMTDGSRKLPRIRLRCPSRPTSDPFPHLVLRHRAAVRCAPASPA